MISENERGGGLMFMFDNLPTIMGYKHQPVRLDEPIERLYGRLKDRRCTALLKTGIAQNGHRFSVMGTKPFLIFQSKRHDVQVFEQGRIHRLETDPFRALQWILDHYQGQMKERRDDAIRESHGAAFPVLLTGGGIGAFSYDLNRIIFCFFSEFLIMDETSGHGLHVKIDLDRGGLDADAWPDKNQGAAENEEEQKESSLGEMILRSNFSKEEYIEAVKQVRECIASGEIYQVNLSQQFRASYSGDPFLIFERLNRQNPAPMSAYFDFGEIAIISSSPERFLMRRGNYLESRPIKGTMPRGKTAEDDQRHRNALLSSKKEEAELSMIVDLMRNDLGKLAQYGTVRVINHKEIEEYSNVFQMLSTISAEVTEETPSLELIRSCFPGGSVTGCPKLQAMKIIEKMERARRGFYCGSLGYIDFQGNFDLNVAIRTITAIDDHLFFNLGGGIVFDSDPAREYEETLHKGRTIFEALQ